MLVSHPLSLKKMPYEWTPSMRVVSLEDASHSEGDDGAVGLLGSWLVMFEQIVILSCSKTTF